MERSMDDKSLTDSLLRANQTILYGGLFNSPRLTPTGKISHAKTRVYTQRYRKEWEQMPDFKGWLTSVPNQATRAYCTFCKKNLHAHRLSLLKHTCTMKHQRAALVYQNELNARQAAAAKVVGIDAGYMEEVVQKANEEDNEDFEYVVETLEMEDDELNDSQCKDQQIDPDSIEEYDDGNIIASRISDRDLLTSKKIKMEREEDYLEDEEEQVTAEVEMVIGDHQTIRDTENDASSNSNDDNGYATQNTKNEDFKQKFDDEKLSLQEEDSSETGSESGTLATQRLEEIGNAFANLKDVLNTSKVPSTFGTPVSVPAGQTKTIRLNSGKTVTLKAGTQYILSNFKSNSIPSILVSDRKQGMTSKDNITIKSSTPVSPKSKLLTSPAVAGTSKQTSNQTTEESPKPVVGKKPCISTHVLDTSKGVPIGGLQVSLYKLMDGRWTFLNESTTSANGRCNDLVDTGKSSFTAGRYKMHFDVDKYFTLRRVETMYPFIEIVFDVKNPTGNYHIPVLLSPFGYTTYRGSER